MTIDRERIVSINRSWIQELKSKILWIMDDQSLSDDYKFLKVHELEARVHELQEQIDRLSADE